MNYDQIQKSSDSLIELFKEKVSKIFELTDETSFIINIINALINYCLENINSFFSASEVIIDLLCVFLEVKYNYNILEFVFVKKRI